MTAAVRSALRIETGTHQSGRSVPLPTTTFFVDDVDFFALERQRRKGGWKTYRPTDPVGLLPPDSRVLLPSAAPGQAMIGVCSCRESGCDSLWLAVRRDGDEVYWEPVERQTGHSIQATYRFDLRQYLDAIDAGTASLTWERRPRLLARRIREEQRDSVFGFLLANYYHLLDARAWPGQDRINVTVVGPKGSQYLELPVPDELSDDQILDQLRRMDPQVFPALSP
jgi:hypothetical protein